MDDRRILSSEEREDGRQAALIADEFLAGFEAVARIDRPAVTIFGSARVPAGNPTYEAARETGRLFAEAGFAVVTGGGPGVMEAANLDERADTLLEARLARDSERLLVACPRLLGIDALLQAVVTGHEELLNAYTRTVLRHPITVPTRKPMQAAASHGPIRVLIADDHRLFAQALEAILDAEQEIDVVGYASDGREAVDLAGTLSPDVVLMDISMPTLDGIEATRLILRGKTPTRVLMLTGSNSRHDVDRAREAGAAGYVTKDRIAAELVDAIRDVARRALS